MQVVVPIHSYSHWCLAVINIKEKKIQYFDSLNGGSDGILKALVCATSCFKLYTPLFFIIVLTVIYIFSLKIFYNWFLFFFRPIILKMKSRINIWNILTWVHGNGNMWKTFPNKTMGMSQTTNIVIITCFTIKGFPNHIDTSLKLKFNVYHLINIGLVCKCFQIPLLTMPLLHIVNHNNKNSLVAIKPFLMTSIKIQV